MEVKCRFTIGHATGSNAAESSSARNASGSVDGALVELLTRVVMRASLEARARLARAKTELTSPETCIADKSI